VTDKIKKLLVGVVALAALALGGSALAGAAAGGGGKDSATLQPSQAAEAPEGKESENGATDTDNVQEENGKDDASEESEKGESEGSDKPVTGEAATRAKQAAASETGGKAGDVERDGEKGAVYEVEVTKANGKQADVRLDGQFKVVAVDEDSEQDETGENDQADEASAPKR